MSTMNFNFTDIIEEGSYDPQPDDDRLHYLFGFEVKLWQDDSNLIPDTIKSESIDSYTQTWAEGGEEKSYEGVTEEQTVHTKTQGAWPDTLEVGSSWTFSEDTSTSSTSRSRMNGGEWDVETSETEESETTDYEVTDEAKVTTSAGTFDTLIVKAVLQGEGQGNYTLEYINSDFIRIKRVVIENDESILTMQILEYSISSLESPSSEDGDSIAEGLPHLGRHDSLRGKSGRFHCRGRICRMAGASHRADTGDRGISGRGMVRLRLGGWQGPLVDQVSSG